MNLGVALLVLWHLWPETEGDWMPPEHNQRILPLAWTLVVETARPAQCKVRPEVMEITRSMVDPTRANFYLWPSCVEVQRCSGCCNIKNYKCQPTQIQERRVRFVKKVFKRRGIVSKTAVIVLHDHVACKCMTAAQYADTQDREGSLASPAPTIARARKYSSSKRKHRKFKLFDGKKGIDQT
ncbi:platelet-derived growth factor subunit B-like isoform X2 [Rhinoraja longicauda]